jgi:hypothetical protein
MTFEASYKEVREGGGRREAKGSKDKWKEEQVK